MPGTPEEIAAAKEAEANEGKTAEEIAAEKKVEDEKGPSDPNKIDYKAEAEKLKKQNEQAGHNIEDERAKRLAAEAKAKELEAEAENLANESGKSIEEAKEELRTENKKEMDSMKSDLLKDVVTDELDTLTKNEDEKELIKLIYEQKIADKGTTRAEVREALEDARILANKPRFQNAINEANATNNSNKSLGNGGAANADNSGSEGGDSEAQQIENEMGGDLPASFK